MLSQNKWVKHHFESPVFQYTIMIDISYQRKNNLHYIDKIPHYIISIFESFNATFHWLQQTFECRGHAHNHPTFKNYLMTRLLNKA